MFQLSLKAALAEARPFVFTVEVTPSSPYWALAFPAAESTKASMSGHVAEQLADEVPLWEQLAWPTWPDTVLDSDCARSWFVRVNASNT
jgi:hypothetical protein